MLGLAERVAQPAAPLLVLSAVQTHGSYWNRQTRPQQNDHSPPAWPNPGCTDALVTPAQHPAEPSRAQHSPTEPSTALASSKGISPWAAIRPTPAPCPPLAGGEVGSGLRAGSVPVQLGLIPTCKWSANEAPKARSWLVSAVRSLVGSLAPLAVSLHDYPMSHLGNTSTGKRQLRRRCTLRNRSRREYSGMLRSAKRPSWARKDKPWHACVAYLPSSPLGKKCQGMTPDSAGENSGDSSAWRGRGWLGD